MTRISTTSPYKTPQVKAAASLTPPKFLPKATFTKEYRRSNLSHLQLPELPAMSDGIESTGRAFTLNRRRHTARNGDADLLNVLLMEMPNIESTAGGSVISLVK
mmetsp:Transcript_33101/g.51319  ORF Transcript_33101/g.51319 Transcript_33101/m.51319 type:complete len:104 (-) Transcript_33101:282-593(-)|eukprot:CAMPEP_0117001030 /NCGR_PEP_ID=MMETSP0472-20121206/3170_1 /TAXON_ID=693140 ORGANISM="Tiarina fusus, Strain LIS" /NCGR_SAMPLE_ID=MMETSP0472 /ASSEMBLY_ACC=CAM_ASM_000603 /LENGTH=103 /DNA_ID=CAMNT_0004700911 /DNA_START=38 /DNA_END=349 /DNA_ORIENTATION=-